MSRENSGLKASVLLLALVISLVTCPTFSYVAPIEGVAAYTAAAKCVEFHFHHVDSPVHVAGLDTKYIMNTSKWFSFSTQQNAYANSFYKPIGQPKIAVDFYLYPNLAGPVVIDGMWQVFIWANSSAYKPTGFNLEFKEITAGGVILWDSGPLSPTVTSSIGSYIDVPVYSYNLSKSLKHAFSAGSTIQVEVTVNAGSSANTRIWYDSPLYPSKMILPLQDYARPVSVKTYDANYTETKVYSVFWKDSQRKVIVQANVTDPLGGYDIYMVNVTISGPDGKVALGKKNMIRTTDGMWKVNYSHIYEVGWPYSNTSRSGTYTIEVSVVDNNGYCHLLNYGVFDPYIEYRSQSFSIGVQFLVQIKAIDTHDQSLTNADVRAISGGVTLARGYTNSSGWWKNGLWVGYYNITIYWYGIEVAKEPVQVVATSDLTIRCKVYYPSFKTVDETGKALAEAEVYVKSPNGTISVPPFFTPASGFINFTRMPVGNYTFTILWKGVNVQDATIAVNSDGPYTVKTRVYQLTLKIVGNDGTPVQGAYAIIYTQSGVGYGFELTDVKGEATFRLPVGIYKIDVRFSTVYWLSAVTTSATKTSYGVNSSGLLSITLTDFPPAIWSTTGFLLIAVAVIAVVLIVVYRILRRRK